MRDERFLPFGLFLLGLVLGVLIGALIQNDVWRRDAAKRGKAEFGATENGTLVWRWKP